MSISKPMLAETCTDTSALRFPVLATPKLDGIRCLTRPNELSRPSGNLQCLAVSRKFKPIPNVFIRDWVESNLPPGLDGELVVVDESGIAKFQETTSGVMGRAGEPLFQYWVFDYFGKGTDMAYEDRVQWLQRLRLPRGRVKLILPVTVHDEAGLLDFEAKCLAEGHEGVMIRTHDSPYKCGRSTVREQWLLKIKRFSDAEGYVVGFVEAMTNTNEATKDELGHTKRSTAKAGKVGKGHVGAFIMKPCAAGKVTEEDYSFIRANAHRLDQALMNHPYLFTVSVSTLTKGGNHIPMVEEYSYLGRMFTYKYQAIGQLVKPRFPVLKGERSGVDVGDPE